MGNLVSVPNVDSETARIAPELPWEVWTFIGSKGCAESLHLVCRESQRAYSHRRHVAAAKIQKQSRWRRTCIELWKEYYRNEYSLSRNEYSLSAREIMRTLREMGGWGVGRRGSRRSPRRMAFRLLNLQHYRRCLVDPTVQIKMEDWMRHDYRFCVLYDNFCSHTPDPRFFRRPVVCEEVEVMWRQLKMPPRCNVIFDYDECCIEMSLTQAERFLLQVQEDDERYIRLAKRPDIKQPLYRCGLLSPFTRFACG